MRPRLKSGNQSNALAAAAYRMLTELLLYGSQADHISISSSWRVEPRSWRSRWRRTCSTDSCWYKVHWAADAGAYSIQMAHPIPIAKRLEIKKIRVLLQCLTRSTERTHRPGGAQKKEVSTPSRSPRFKNNGTVSGWTSSSQSRGTLTVS